MSRQPQNISTDTMDENQPSYRVQDDRRVRPTRPSRNRERYTVSSYFRTYWMDYLTMVLMGVLGLGIYELRPAPNRLFPIYFSSDGEIVYPEFAYPLRKNIIPIWLAAFIAFMVPFVFIIITQVRVRSFVDANAATMGLLFSLITAAVFQVFLKWLIGGLRPHFYSVCQPNITPGTANKGQGFQGIMVDRSVCTGDDKEINDSLESFPSGHSTAAFAGFLYLSLYLNGKHKIFSNFRPQYWKLILFYFPLLSATLITSSLTIDEYHNWYDCLAGAIIGSICAVGAYRFQYASIWDYRFNHVPLPRSVEGAGVEGNGYRYEIPDSENTIAPWTRRAGWGQEQMVLGAPDNALYGAGMGGGAGYKGGNGGPPAINQV